MNYLKNKKILVTGGTGYIGSEIVRRSLEYNPEVVRIFSNDEDSTFKMMQELGEYDIGPSDTNVRFLIGNVRDKERLKMAMKGIDIVYHAAALKHVPLCEYNPFEAVKTNVIGTQNVIESAIENGVQKVINISTDKAVNPVNTMGATKLLTEKLIIDANDGGCIFSSVRFGNVLFSRGSVIPLFEKQIREKKMITTTDRNMIRYIMSVKDTVDLVFKVTLMAKGGEIFILKMSAVKLGDLADAIVDIYSEKYGLDNIKEQSIGLRPGEKMFEELMTEIEGKVAFETDDMFIVPPRTVLQNLQFDVLDYEGARHNILHKYTSDNAKVLSKEKIKKLLYTVGSLGGDKK